MEKISVIAITKNGIKIGMTLKSLFPSWKIYAPQKFEENNLEINWYSEPTAKKIMELFCNNEGLICLFSLGAVIRLIAPLIKDKKTDPAIIVIDDKTNFVISVLSGHLGGANKLTNEIAEKLDAVAVVTTAADVNKTIAVDLLGREFGWKIEDDSTVTKISAYMVNEERIGIYQDSGLKKWWNAKLPKNVTIYSNLKDLKNSRSKGYLIISDRYLDLDILNDSVIYRPPTLVVGVGLHGDTTRKIIKEGLDYCLRKYQLSQKSIAKFVSIKKKENIRGLIELGKELNVPVKYFEKSDLASIIVPNPSEIVEAYEGIQSVSEASAIKESGGTLIVQKQKFPPNLTIAIARIPN